MKATFDIWCIKQEKQTPNDRNLKISIIFKMIYGKKFDLKGKVKCGQWLWQHRGPSRSAGLLLPLLSVGRSRVPSTSHNPQVQTLAETLLRSKPVLRSPPSPVTCSITVFFFKQILCLHNFCQNRLLSLEERFKVIYKETKYLLEDFL